jgi:phosphotransferase system  glucose/maltose/N-acetylglucosamine-specific IIC component
MFAVVSAMLIFIGTICIFDAIASRIYKQLAFSIATTVFSGVICYISLSNLPDSHNYPWYWNAAAPVGIFLFAVAFVVLSAPKNKGN